MADIELIIKMPEEILNDLRTCKFPIQDAYRLCSLIEDGIILPKGHGRLIDADELESKRCDYITSGFAESVNDCTEFGMLLITAPVLVEADKGGERMNTTRNLFELNKLEKYLIHKNIPYKRIDEKGVIGDINGTYFDRHQIFVPNDIAEEYKWDVICQYGSYGYEKGLLEIMGEIVSKSAVESVEGWLTADDVIARIERKVK